MKKFVSIGLLLFVAGCGGSDSPTRPSDQNPPPTGNRNPAIANVQVTPTFGIADLTVFSFSASASDPDNDSLTYSWSIAGGTYPGSNGQLLFPSPGGQGRATVTVTDGKGGTASSTANFIVGSMQGNWIVTTGPAEVVAMTLALNQSPAGIVTGNFNLPLFGPANSDPAEPGSITAQGQFRLRVKVGRFTDFTMTGTMDTTGGRVTGVLNGSGYSGQPFVMVKQ